MPLFCVDLDGTLVDRDDAVRRWAERFADDRGLDPSMADAIVAADGRGLRPKPEVRTDLTRLLDLSPQESEKIISVVRAGVVEHLSPAAGAIDGLDRMRQAGWDIVIVTNGATLQQQRKIDKLGLADLVDAWIISEACGIEKPDPEIFRMAARKIPEADLATAWHVGDSAEADIQGAHNVGIPSVYLRHGRDWTPGIVAPTAFADSFGEAVDIILASSSAAV